MAWPPTTYAKLDNMTLAAHVVEEIRTWRPDAVFIDEGNGGGVIDRLRQLGHNVIGVHFGGKASRPRYQNKRTEMWFEMRDWLQAGGVLPPSVALKQDLAAPTYSFTSATDVYALEPKDKIKERIKRSPDLGDALALTFAHPVHRDARVEMLAAHGIHVDTGVDGALDYDPLACF